MKTKIVITESGDELSSKEVLENEKLSLRVDVSESNKYASLNFTSRLAMYDFALSLLHESIYGQSGQQEFFPLEFDGKMQIVNGVRMEENSSRLFVFYQKDLSM